MYSVQKQIVVYLQPKLVVSKKSHLIGACKESNQEVCIKKIEVRKGLDLTEVEIKTPLDGGVHIVKFFPRHAVRN